jgi:hypothetical protein
MKLRMIVAYMFFFLSDLKAFGHNWNLFHFVF